MRPHLNSRRKRHVLALELLDQLKVVIPPLKIITININKQPDNFSKHISKDDGKHDECKDRIDAFNRIPWNYIPIGYRSHYTNAIIHNVDILILPG